MIRNILYCFRFDAGGMRKALVWEVVHSFLLSAPSGMLLVIIWELFRADPDTTRIWGIVALMGAMFVVQLYVARQAMIRSNVSIYRISTQLRLNIGNKLQRLSMGYYKHRDPGDLASVALQDVANFEQIFGHSIANIVTAIIGTVALSTFLIILDFRLGLTLVAALGIVFPLAYLGQRLVRRYGRQLIAARTQTNARFLEYIQGMRHARAYGMTGRSFRTLEAALDALRIRSIRVEAIPGPMILSAGVILELFFVLMVWMGLYFLSGQTLEIPVFIAFLIVGYRLYEPLKILMVEYGVLSFMNVSLDRIVELMGADEQAAGRNLQPEQFDIRFSDVSFGYHADQLVLKGVSFEARAGQMTAIVGASGSGKTTVLSLMARFWEVTSGKVQIGGINLVDISPEQVYTMISEVFQEVYLFDGSIYDNILIGNPTATAAEVEAAAAKAQLMEFVEELPEGLGTMVGEGGRRLSGGQKQRVSIARALLKDAPIILLDEATSSLDPENEIYVQRAIHELVRNKTVVVIAHRLSTIRNADQILVLGEGQIQEQGMHGELMAARGQYARMWELQAAAGVWKMA